MFTYIQMAAFVAVVFEVLYSLKLFPIISSGLLKCVIAHNIGEPFLSRTGLILFLYTVVTS